MTNDAVSLPVLIQEVFASFCLQASQKNIEFKVLCESKVPEFFESDPGRLKQILMNIVGNALKFTKVGTVTLKVIYTPKTSTQESFLEFLVVDTGIGIPDLVKNELFQPFTQADSSTTRSFGGTGLGLVLSRQLAKLLGGNVELVESKENQGSTFSISIACNKPSNFIELTSQNILRKNEKSSTADLSLRNLKILVAEDSPESQFLIRHILESAGATVFIVDDGHKAVNMALTSNFDVMIMDIEMPGIDGFNATRLLRSRDFTKPIIMLSAHALVDLRYRSVAAGCDAHLSKPVSKSELLEKIIELVRK